MLYIEEKTTNNTIGKENPNLMPDIDDTFRPSGAVTEMYGEISSSSSITSPSPSYPTNDITLPKKGSIDKKIPDSDTKFCFECGSNLKSNSKFCRNCGTKQE
jgi:hypothetical protein